MNVISFSLWGDIPKYTLGAIKNARLSPNIYPGWTCRFYTTRTVPQNILRELEAFDHVQVIRMNKDGNWGAMFDRFYAACDPDIDAVIFRDTDSRLNWREAHAVNEWMKSDKQLHIMRDHPFHGTELLGGMWGIKKGLINDLQFLLDHYHKGDFWQVDQNFLREKIYPRYHQFAMVHDEFFERRPFPTKREGLEFVGEIYDENNVPNQEHREVLAQVLHEESR